MISLVTVVVCTLIGVVVTRLMVKPETTVVTNFTCPYCKVDVTGAKQLDLINHIPCINKSDEDLAAMRKVEKEDEYFSTIRLRKRKNGEDFDYCFISGSEFWTHGFTLYRNGEKIFSGYAINEAAAAKRINEEIALDKHKRSAKEDDDK